MCAFTTQARRQQLQVWKQTYKVNEMSVEHHYHRQVKGQGYGGPDVGKCHLLLGSLC